MLAFLGVLACVSAGVLSAEPPVSPWQALNPALGEPTRAEMDAAREEFDDTPYDVTYPEGHNETEVEYYEEEDSMIPELPFKLPFKMDKKQTAVAAKLLKEAVKPILKSKRLQDFVAYLDDSMASYKSDLETQMYVTLVLDSLQEIYEGKETSELNIILKRFFKNMSDEETARSIDSLWRSYVTPALTSYIYNPMRNYVVTPVRSYIYEPITNYFTEFAERIETWMESSRRPYIDIQYPEYQRWSQTFNDFTNRISDWTDQAREGLKVARRMLELQDQARGCYDCGAPQDMTSQEIYSVQVHDVSFLGWLLGGLGIILGVVALSAIAPAVAIPVALGVGLGAGGGPTGTAPQFIQVPVQAFPPPAPAPFVIAGTGPQATAPVFAPVPLQDGGTALAAPAAPADLGIAGAPGGFGDFGGFSLGGGTGPAAAPGTGVGAPGAGTVPGFGGATGAGGVPGAGAGTGFGGAPGVGGAPGAGEGTGLGGAGAPGAGAGTGLGGVPGAGGTPGAGGFTAASPGFGVPFSLNNRRRSYNPHEPSRSISQKFEKSSTNSQVQFGDEDSYTFYTRSDK